jgi:3-mercaptopyruvate sulfurtransferase SseA
MKAVRQILLGSLIFVLTSLACNALLPRAEPTSASAPTQSIEPVFTQSSENLPQSDADVPRVSPEEARAALESGAAVVVDVRPSDAFEASHIAGAISLPLAEIERNPANLALEKDQWIITYCT